MSSCWGIGAVGQALQHERMKDASSSSCCYESSDRLQ